MLCAGRHYFFICVGNFYTLWILFFTEGQALYKKINKMLKKAQAKVSDLLKKYNEMSELPTKHQALLPVHITHEDVTNMDFFNSYASAQQNTIAECADLLARLERSQEEQRIVLNEMVSIKDIYVDKMRLLEQSLNDSTSDAIKARIKKQLCIHEMIYYESAKMFSNHVTMGECSFHFSHDVGLLSFDRVNSEVLTICSDSENDVSSDDESNE